MSANNGDLTDRQKDILEFIRKFQRTNGMPPSIREICFEFEINSPNGVMTHIKALEKKGVLVRNERGLSRGWRPVTEEGCCAACGSRLETAK